MNHYDLRNLYEHKYHLLLSKIQFSIDKMKKLHILRPANIVSSTVTYLDTKFIA